MSKSLRKNDSSQLGTVKYCYLNSFSETSKGLIQRQALTGVEVLGRLLRLIQTDHLSKYEAYGAVSEELSEFWIYGLNIYPINLNNIKNKVKTIYEGNGGFRLLKKGEARGEAPGRTRWTPSTTR